MNSTMKNNPDDIFNQGKGEKNSSIPSILLNIMETRSKDLINLRKFLKDLCGFNGNNGNNGFIKSLKNVNTKPKNDSDINKRLTLSQAIDIHYKNAAQNNTYLNPFPFIISELKPASPSMGKLFPQEYYESQNDNIRNDEEQYKITSIKPSIIKRLIDDMVRGGANAISVLTEPNRFCGAFGNLSIVNNILPLNYPILMKDFVIDESQIYMGIQCGASNGLVIAAMPNPVEIARMMSQVGMEPLIEIHTIEDLEKIKCLRNADFNFVIGINNRNLHKMKLDLSITDVLLPKVRSIFSDMLKDKIKIITESGIYTGIQLKSFLQKGIDGALIGTSILKSNIPMKLKELKCMVPPFIKICGLKNIEVIIEGIKKLIKNNKKGQYNRDGFPITTSNLNEIVPTAMGFVVNVPSSPRNQNVADVKKIFNSIQQENTGASCDLSKNILTELNKTARVIVTKNINPLVFKNLYHELNPDFIQPHQQDPFKFVEQLGNFNPDYFKNLILPLNIEKLMEIGYSVEELIVKINSLPAAIFALLIDSSAGKSKRYNEKIIRILLNRLENRRILLAGGIKPSDLKLLFSLKNLYGVDLSSSLESEPGVKDVNKIMELLEQFVTIKINYEKRSC